MPRVPPGRARSWQGALERSSADFGIVLVGLELVTVALTLRHLSIGRLIPDAHGRLVLIGAETLLLVVLAVARRPVRTPIVLGSLVLAGLAIMVASVAASHDPHLDAPAFDVLTLVGVTPLALMLVLTMVDLRWTMLALVATGPLYVGLWLAIDGTDHLRHAVDSWPTPVTFAAATALLWPPLRHAAQRIDRLDDQARAQEARMAEAEHFRRAAEESRRLVHDDVISALRAVELELPRPAVISAATTALAAIGKGPVVAGSQADLLAQVTSVPGVDVTVVGGWDGQGPAQVLTALTGAAREALRNVARHAGVDQAVVRLGHEGDTLVVEVSDGGLGASAAGFGFGFGTGFGTERSIRGRLAEVGGTAEIIPGPGGTTVRLAWSPPVTAREPVPDILDRHRLYLQLTALAVIGQLLLVVRFPGDPVALSAVVWVASAVVAFGTAHYVTTRTPGIRGLVVVTAATVLLTVAGLSLQPDGALVTADWWPLAINLAAPLLYAAETPAVWSLLPISAMVGTVAGFAAHDPLLTPLQPVGLLMTPIAVIGGGAVFGEVLRRGSEDAVEAGHEHRARTEELAWHAAYERAVAHHAQLISGDVTRFLTHVLESPGAAEPAEAARLAEECRDALYVAEPLPAAVRRALQLARDRGSVVTFHATDGRRRITAAGWSALEDVLARADGRRISIRPPDGRRPRLEIAIVPPLEPAALGSLGSLAGTIEAAPGATVVTVDARPA